MEKNKKNKISLDSLDRKLPFSVPDDYFDNFYGRLRERMEVKTGPGLFRKTYQLIKPQLALAAAIAAFVIIGYTAVRFFSHDISPAETTDEIDDIIEYCIYDFDDDMLISTLAEEENVSWWNSSMETEEILDYLSEENDIDYFELIDIY
jgi:hypothetical protein